MYSKAFQIQFAAVLGINYWTLTQKKLQQGVYEKMKQSGRQYSLDLRQIDLDINRTFRDNIAYKVRYCQRYSKNHDFEYLS